MESEDNSMSKNIKVDFFLDQPMPWQAEFKFLRELCLSCDVEEELKWGQPCYSLDGKNVFLIHGFKDYFALLFMKGALMEDPHQWLIQQTKNVQAGRQLRFRSMEEIQAKTELIKTYLLEAIRVEREGLEVEFKQTPEFEMVDELKQRFYEQPDLKTAFEALTPGRQRAYLLFFSSAKQTRTRLARIDKCTDLIMDGKGLND